MRGEGGGDGGVVATATATAMTRGACHAGCGKAGHGREAAAHHQSKVPWGGGEMWRQ